MEEKEINDLKPKNGRACEGSKPEGSPCAANVMEGENFCFFHHPDTAQDRKAAQRRGGKRNRAPVLPADAAELVLNSDGEVVTFLTIIIDRVSTGKLGTKEATAIGYLIKIRQEIKSRGDLEERLTALEARLKARPPKEGLFDPNGGDWEADET